MVKTDGLLRLKNPEFKKLRRIFTWTFFIFGFFAFQEKSSWPLLRLAGIRSFSFFTDLGWVFKTADSAKIIGWNIYDPQPPKDYSAYLYGSNLIRAVNLFGITESQTKFVGWVFMLVFSLFVAIILVHLNFRNKLILVFCFALWISPPNQLLLERGNFDVVMIIALALISLLIVKQHYYLAIILLMTITLFKFYTLPLFIYIIYLYKDRLKKYVGGFIFLTTTCLVVLDLGKIKIDFPRPSWAAFGNPIFGLYFHRFKIDLPSLVQDIIGLACLIFALVIIKILLRKTNRSLPNTSILKYPNNFIDSIFNIFVLTFLVCYFSSTSFDYRLVFLMVPALIYIGRDQLDKKIFICLGILLILSSWLSYNSGDFQLIGDICILFWISIFVRSILIEFESSKFCKNPNISKIINLVI
jgi:hypothetical protein